MIIIVTYDYKYYYYCCFNVKFNCFCMLTHMFNNKIIDNNDDKQTKEVQKHPFLFFLNILKSNQKFIQNYNPFEIKQSKFFQPKIM